MGLYLNSDSGEQIELASNTGWSVVGAWIDALPVDAYPDLVGLWEHGWADPVSTLRTQLAAALENHAPAEPDAEKTAREMLASLGKLADDSAVVVNDGTEADPVA